MAGSHALFVCSTGGVIDTMMCDTMFLLAVEINERSLSCSDSDVAMPNMRINIIILLEPLRNARRMNRRSKFYHQI